MCPSTELNWDSTQGWPLTFSCFETINFRTVKKLRIDSSQLSTWAHKFQDLTIFFLWSIFSKINPVFLTAQTFQQTKGQGFEVLKLCNRFIHTKFISHVRGHSFAYFWLRNLSGLNSSGSSHHCGLWWIKVRFAIIFVP